MSVLDICPVAQGSLNRMQNGKAKAVRISKTKFISISKGAHKIIRGVFNLLVQYLNIMLFKILYFSTVSILFIRLLEITL